MSLWKKTLGIVVVGVLIATGSFAGVPAGTITALEKSAAQGKTLARRRAARRLIAIGVPAKAAILELAKSDDLVIKRTALRRVIDVAGEEAVPILKAALRDPGPFVRIVAVEELLAVRPRTKDVSDALMAMTSDQDTDVRKAAASAFWTFRRNVVPLRKRPSWDHTIEVIARKPLPLKGWKFRKDPGRVGHIRNWFAPELSEEDWVDIEIGKFWQDAAPDAVGKYTGIGWYRRVIDLPGKPAGKINDVVIHFEAVDESTWLWINGEYAGLHDIGPNGWQTPCDINIAPFVKWGEPNQITIRVLNTAFAGGIWKPAEFQVLK